MSIDFDVLYFYFCIIMRRSEHEFFFSRFSKVIKMIDMYADSKRIESAAINGEQYETKYFGAPVKTVKSMREIEGFV